MLLKNTEKIWSGRRDSWTCEELRSWCSGDSWTTLKSFVCLYISTVDGRKGKGVHSIRFSRSMWPRQGLRLTIVKYNKWKPGQLLNAMTISDWSPKQGPTKIYVQNLRTPTLIGTKDPSGSIKELTVSVALTGIQRASDLSGHCFSLSPYTGWSPKCIRDLLCFSSCRAPVVHSRWSQSKQHAGRGWAEHFIFMDFYRPNAFSIIYHLCDGEKYQ